MKLHIKNMVCIRCKIIVEQILKDLAINYIAVELGSADVIQDLSPARKHELNASLNGYGLELIEDKRICLIEKVKCLIIQYVQYSDVRLKINFSTYISANMHYDYTYLANIFSEVEGITIEHFIIVNKVEKVKELLSYNEMSIKEIAFKLQYSSVAHLSNQFKKVTGMCPSEFKTIKENRYVA
ncbi:helix-turn-helix domain-containing protein [Mucilaginibacter litoreus]|uniref:Helix-turn-helix domain-containing protein n=1 Tax=Mucilaginibacter litoreus TaxID=1048221 RepID=A0ABW3AWG8_9SPHI